jgi:hypothetical protein
VTRQQPATRRMHRAIRGPLEDVRDEIGPVSRTGAMPAGTMAHSRTVRLERACQAAGIGSRRTCRVEVLIVNDSPGAGNLASRESDDEGTASLSRYLLLGSSSSIIACSFHQSPLARWRWRPAD